MHRKPLNFSVMAAKGTTLKLKVMDAKLYATRVKLTNASTNSYERLLSSRGFLYPSLTVTTRTKTISKGDQNVDWIPYNGLLPRRLYFFQITQDAFNNTLEENPFNFQAFSIDRIQVFKNGLSLPTAQGLANIQENRYLQAYIQTFLGVNSPTTFNIEHAKFQFGYFIVAVDITNDVSSGCGYENPQASGTLRIAIDYKEALTSPITLFCVAETPGYFKLGSDRSISWSY